MGNIKPLFCAGKWKTTEDGLDVVSPYDGSVSATVSLAGESEVEEATAGAVAAFEEMKNMPSWKREEILSYVRDGLISRTEEIARVITSENGKPISQSRIEVGRAANVFKISAEEARRVGGEFIPMDTMPGAEGRWGLHRRFPIGPIFGITPFNFPLNLAAHKLAPAIAAGNSIVIKPASPTPLSSLLLAEICEEAGLPAGALSVLPCSTALASGMVEDDRFKMITFTGSPGVGWVIKARSGKKKVALELGGNAGVIVHSDADIANAASRCVAGAFAYSGQVCISLQRILVHQDLYHDFVAEVVRLTNELVTGSPNSDDTNVGPMINEKEALRAMAWIDEAVAGGAKILTGGELTGTMLTPTVVADTAPEMKVNCDEIFAPVVTITPYDDVSEAIRMVDDSEYGLQAGLFTFDARIINEAFRGIEAGGLMVNEVPTYRQDHTPYGGVKNSGLGREGIIYTIEEMTEGRFLMMAGL